MRFAYNTLLEPFQPILWASAMMSNSQYLNSARNFTIKHGIRKKNDSFEHAAHQDPFQSDTDAVIDTHMPESSQIPPGTKRQVQAV